MSSAASSPGAIECRDLTVQVGEHHLLTALNVRLEPGQFTAVCGANGAGKSTLLSAISGSRKPSCGQITLQDRAMSDWSALALARRRSVLSQQSDLSFGFRVREVVQLGRAPHASTVSPRENDEIVVLAMEALGITEFAERNYLILSGGERQRVHLARVLAQAWGKPGDHDIGWLLLDEPTAALDLRYQIDLMRLLRHRADLGGGIVAVLHDLSLVYQWADRCLLMRQGILVADGPPAQVLTVTSISAAYDIAPDDVGVVLPLVAAAANETA